MSSAHSLFQNRRVGLTFRPCAPPLPPSVPCAVACGNALAGEGRYSQKPEGKEMTPRQLTSASERTVESPS